MKRNLVRVEAKNASKFAGSSFHMCFVHKSDNDIKGGKVFSTDIFQEKLTVSPVLEIQEADSKFGIMFWIPIKTIACWSMCCWSCWADLQESRITDCSCC